MSNVGQQLLSGALSGLATTICLQPFDFLKTRVQQEDGVLRPKNSAVIWNTARHVVATNGVTGLWRGTAASLVRNVPGVALYFTTLTQLRGIMATSPYFVIVRQKVSNGQGSGNASVLPKLSNQGNLLAGATTRVGVGFILNPFSVLKARFESNMYAYESLFGALKSIARQGPSELLRGFLASSLRDAPYAGLFVVFYEGIKRETGTSSIVPGQAVFFERPLHFVAEVLHISTSAQSSVLHSVAAASASALATAITHPFDVIKTKIQVRSEARYNGLLRTAHTIWAQRGAVGFLDGLSLRMARKVGSSAIGWAVYEALLMFLHRSRALKDP
ncbi:hypothetical protein HGRIS_009183 [Hohenbuehelia grisea]|uniref:Mitochondrial glycine transporter n=1 Tax=Hohenbuehelia grisea TaxID=104357 RepID=A0ABR3J0J9_9AGAR